MLLFEYYIILHLHAFDGLDCIDMTEERRNLFKAVFNVEGCNKNLLEDPNNKYEILSILNETKIYDEERIYVDRHDLEYGSYVQGIIGFDELTQLHKILQSDPIPTGCECHGTSMTEKEYIEISNRCYGCDHIVRNQSGISFHENHKTVFYPNKIYGYSIEEAQCILAHIMRFGSEIKNNVDNNTAYNIIYTEEGNWVT
ncbi:unnamed protein product [Cunninghamella echinulata]